MLKVGRLNEQDVSLAGLCVPVKLVAEDIRVTGICARQSRPLNIKLCLSDIWAELR